MTNPFQAAMERVPLIAILRGVRPDEVVEIGTALVEAGIELIEVPLNSPQPFDSIARLVAALGARAVIGAGTVLSPDDVTRLVDAGGQIAVSPNMNHAVITKCRSLGIDSLPGIATVSEAFAAIDAHASALKLFPAEASSPVWLKALRAVLPVDIPVLPVGGIQPDNMLQWLDAGAQGFGLGSSLYRAGDDASQYPREPQHMSRCGTVIRAKSCGGSVGRNASFVRERQELCQVYAATANRCA